MNDRAILEALLDLKEMAGEHKGQLQAIEEQARRTNGRVTSLEGTVSMLARVESQNSGIIKGFQDKIAQITSQSSDSVREIDQLKLRKEYRLFKMSRNEKVLLSAIGLASSIILYFVTHG